MNTLVLCCLLTFVAATSIRPQAAMDGDLWWHSRTGSWIVEHGKVPTRDFFTQAPGGRPVVEYSWLFDVLISAAHRHGGLHGVLVFTSFLLMAIVLGLVALFWRTVNFRRAAITAGLVFAAMAPLITPRPWLFSILFFIAEMYLLLTARDSGRVWPVAALIPLFALWANVHIQFVYGLAVLCVFCAERAFQGRARGLLAACPVWWALTAGCFLSTILNPYGWRLWTVVFQYTLQRAPVLVVDEMQPMRFRNVSDWTALLLTCAAMVALGSVRKRPVSLAGILLLATYAGFHAQRDVWFLAIIAGVVWCDCAGQKARREPNTRLEMTAGMVTAGVLLGLVWLAHGASSEKELARAAESMFPVKAAAYVENQGLRNPLYNTFGWGGYLIWRLPGMPVSIDGRANLFGERQIAETYGTLSGGRDWAKDEALLRANTILLDRGCPLATVLMSDARFRAVYEDEIAIVFVPAERQ